MTIEVAEIENLVGKNVILVAHEEGGTESVEYRGTLVTFNSAIGLLFKERGKSRQDIFILNQIDDIREDDFTILPVKSATMKPIAVGSHRAHLAKNHGMNLSEINAMTEDDAKAYHDTVDHADLGHNHDRKSSTPEGDED